MKVVAGGQEIDLGTVEAAPTIGLTDFSRRETDDFGVTTVVERGFARRLSVRLALPFDQVDSVQQQLAALRATPAQWIADDRFAWLNVEGFYKDFELDLAVPPISYCTLTVEGLAETEPGADAGGDPAPSGSRSTLRLLQPIDITSGMLVSSNVVENDHPQWSGAITYAAGARVIVVGTHRIYESLVDANLGSNPVGSPDKWLDVGATNRWAMFDQATGSATKRFTSIAVTLAPGAARAVALLDVVGSTVRVQASGYDQTRPVSGGSALFLDMPGTAGNVTVTVTGIGQVAVGTLLLGQLVDLGVTEASPTAGIIDFSRKEVDNFGEATIVQRAWAKRMTSRALIRTDALDQVANRIAKVRARPSLWIGDEGTSSLTVYGFFKDFSIAVGTNVSTLALSIEGLSEAAKLTPIGGITDWPDVGDPDGTKPADNATNSADPNSPFGGGTVGGVIADIDNLGQQLGDILIDVEGVPSMVDAAELAQQLAEAARDQSQGARDAALGAKNAAIDAATASSGSADVSAGHADVAGSKADEAAGSAQSASASADVAETQAGSAEASRQQAAISESNAAGSASAAFESRTLAAQAKGAAEGFAQASSDAASSAAASVTDAAQHASAASQDRVKAETARGLAEGARDTAVSAKNTAEGFSNAAAISSKAAAKHGGTRGLTPNGRFTAQLEGWAVGTGGAQWINYPDIGPAAKTAIGQYTLIVSTEKVALDPNRTYRISADFIAQVAAQVTYIGIEQYNAAGTSLGFLYIPAQAGAPVLGAARCFGDVKGRLASAPSTPYFYAGTQFHPQATSFAPLALLNYGYTGLAYTDLKALYAEDITEAAQQVSAAAGHAQSAETWSDTAGNHAQAANQSRIDAQAANNNAINRAEAAEDYAVAADASRSAAQASALLSARISHGSSNSNPTFRGMTGTNTLPFDYALWGNAFAAGWTMLPWADGNNPDYSLYAAVPASLDAGVAQTINLSPGKHIVEASAQLYGGSFQGMGIYLEYRNNEGVAFSSASINLALEPTHEKVTAANSSMPLTVKHWSKMMDVPVGTKTAALVVMFNWSGFGRAAKDITMVKALVRPANATEIKAGEAIPALEASVSVNSGAITELKGRARAYLQQVVNAGLGNGATAFLEMRAEVSYGAGPTSQIALGAREFFLYYPAGGTWHKAMTVVGPNVTIAGTLTAGSGMFVGTGIKWPVALRSKDFTVTDGVPVSFGIDFGSVPLFDFKGNNLAPLGAGETYKLYADNQTGTGFTPRLRIITPGTPTAINLTVDTVPGTGPTRQIAKGGNPDASTNVYRLRFQGTFTATPINDGGYTPPGGGGGGDILY